MEGVEEGYPQSISTRIVPCGESSQASPGISLWFHRIRNTICRSKLGAILDEVALCIVCEVCFCGSREL